MRAELSRSTLAGWAEWNFSTPSYTVGIEEEVMLLDPHDWSLAQRIDDVLPRLSPELASRATAETHGAAIELASHPHALAEAAALEIAADLDRRHRATQVVGHRLADGDQADRLLLDVGFERVEARVAFDHGLGEGYVAIGDRADGVGDFGLGQAAHTGELGGNRVEFGVIGFYGVFHGAS